MAGGGQSSAHPLLRVATGCCSPPTSPLCNRHGRRKSPSSIVCVCVCVHLYLSVHTPRKLILVSSLKVFTARATGSPPLQSVCREVQVKHTKSLFSMVNHKGFKFTPLYLQTSNSCMHRTLLHLKPSAPMGLTFRKRKLNSRPQAANLTLAPPYPVHH